MKKHDQIIKHLAKEIPFVGIQTIWEHDEDARWDCDDSLDEDDYMAWQSEVRATCIHSGKTLTGSAYLGGTWEEYGEPHDEDIGGYFPQKCEEALLELAIVMDEADVNASAIIMVRGAAAWCCKEEEVEA